jgi:hypothetical protein
MMGEFAVIAGLAGRRLFIGFADTRLDAFGLSEVDIR